MDILPKLLQCSGNSQRCGSLVGKAPLWVAFLNADFGDNTGYWTFLEEGLSICLPRVVSEQRTMSLAVWFGKRMWQDCNQLTSEVDKGKLQVISVVSSHLVDDPQSGNRLFLTTVVSVESLLHCVRSLTVNWHQSVSLCWEPNDISHGQLLCSDKAKWRLIRDALCRWWYCQWLCSYSMPWCTRKQLTELISITLHYITNYL